MRKKRHHKHHLIDHVPVSNLCDEYQLQPTVFYDWQKQFFENRAAALIRGHNRQKCKEEQRIEPFEGKLCRKNEVFSELIEEHIHLKKSLGISDRQPGSP